MKENKVSGTGKPLETDIIGDILAPCYRFEYPRLG